jgi:hypothetical protein
LWVVWSDVGHPSKTDELGKRCLGLVLVSAFPPFHVWRYGMGGLGTGGTPQIAEAQGGRGGVGISNSFPWVAAEPPLIQAPVKVSLLG